MNTIIVGRFSSDTKPTIGAVRVNTWRSEVRCFSLEDRFRQTKVAGDTRIPSGVFPLRWRLVGRWAERMKKWWGVPGSLEICDVPNFTDVLLHPGNTKGDTAGCLLLGFGADLQTRTISRSKLACEALYKLIHTTGGDWQIDVR